MSHKSSVIGWSTLEVRCPRGRGVISDKRGLLRFQWAAGPAALSFLWGSPLHGREERKPGSKGDYGIKAEEGTKHLEIVQRKIFTSGSHSCH